jgi:peptide chain release factor 2
MMRELSRLKETVTGYYQLARELDDSESLLKMAEDEGDTATADELELQITALAKLAAEREIACLFSGEVDGNDCFMEIHAGAGGTESHDWALMLERMYLRWAERKGFKTEIIHELDGEEVGIKSCTIRIQGQFAYGLCRTESGVHRLVRMSPFNAAGKRQTSFASVWVYPEIDDAIEVEILEKDLRVDTYRASGAGGQHINKTDSAVRITHLPTNIVVQSQADRSQHRNRAECYKMLRARLYEVELQKREAKANALNATKTDNSWGHQIRSYVLQPYQMVKDLRSDYETSDTGGVLDGDLDAFMIARLKQLAT